jgi:hypothetical protein
MKIDASGCSALLLAIGLFVAGAAPSQGAPAVFSANQGSPAAQSAGSALTTPGVPGDLKPVAENQITAPDQLTDADRALHEETPPAPAVAVTANEEPTPRATATMASKDHSLWDETSLIGKIFVGLGTLLTLASAARMFMA